MSSHVKPWGVLWWYGPQSNEEPHLLGNCNDLPPHARGFTIMAFETKRAAQAHIREHYGYIAKRKDLRSFPHFWRVPKAVRLDITVRFPKRA